MPVGGDMSDKTAERPAKAGRARQARAETLDDDLRELYEKYGEEDVPRHIVELAEKVEAARRDQDKGQAADDAGEPAPARKPRG